MQVHSDINGNPNPNILRQGAALELPKKAVATTSDRKNRHNDIVELILRQNIKHFATVERTTSRLFAAIAADTILVTARLIPEVDIVTVNIKIEKIS